MGTDSKLWHKKSNKKIYCDRLYNLKNHYSEAKGLLHYLETKGLPKFMIHDICCELDDITNVQNNPSIYQDIIKKLEIFDDDDILVLIDEHDDNY